MLGSRQDPMVRHAQVFNPIHLITEYGRAVGSAVMQMLLPEDTSENGCGGNHHAAPCDGITVGGAIKLVFWMATAIVLSILLGQLS